jgi:hypothetical protein
MRRALLTLAVTAFTVLALTWSASAASGQVTQFRFSGSFAEAVWEAPTATSVTDTAVFVSTSTQGSQLFADQFTEHLDANGNFTGATDTSAQVTSGFSFTVRQPLASASLSGSGLPATTCTYDANFNLIGCTATTIDVTAAWTGQGPITRGVFTSHFKSDGFSETSHSNGTFRKATATGTFNGNTLGASDPSVTDLSTTKSGDVTVCIGGSC